MSKGKWREYQSYNLDEVSIQVIYGSLLGDGSLCKNHDSANYRFMVTHKTRYLDYLQWKQKMITIPSSMWFDKRRGQVRLQTKSCIELTAVYNLFYKAGVKRIPITIEPTVLFSPLALAVWYMDDGYYSSRDHHAVFSNTTWSDDEATFIVACLSELYGIKCSRWANNRIAVSKSSMDKFLEIVYPFVSQIPSMLYKVGTQQCVALG